MYAAPSTPGGCVNSKAAGRGPLYRHMVPAYPVAVRTLRAHKAVALAYRARDVAASGGLLFGVLLGHVVTVRFVQFAVYGTRKILKPCE